MLFDPPQIAVSHKDMTILRNAFEKERSKGTLGQVQNTLVDNGMTMYLHTSLGGAVWGACEALRNKGIQQRKGGERKESYIFDC